MLPPPAPGSKAYKLPHPSLDEALDQNPSAKRKTSQSSQDNLAAGLGLGLGLGSVLELKTNQTQL